MEGDFTIRMDRPPEVVFAFMMDVANTERWQSVGNGNAIEGDADGLQGG